MSLEEHILQIGTDMVGCTRGCAGIACNQPIGILPRCLVLETEGRSGGHGTVIIGMNPGRSAENEQKFYRDHGQTYQQTVAYWEGNNNDGVGYSHPYYKRLRGYMDELGFNGAILWTELVKCENSPNEAPAMQTFRTCTRLYLQRELEAVPGDWPLIAVSGETYKATAYIFAERTVIGVPHPTGSFGNQFHRLRDVDSLVKVKDFLADAINSEQRQAVWIPELLS